MAAPLVPPSPATALADADLLLAAAVETESGSEPVDEAEVDKELQNLAEEQGQNVDRLRATMEKNNQLLLLRAQIREEKILDFLMGKAEVTEAPDPAPENASAGSGSESGSEATGGVTTGETATAT